MSATSNGAPGAAPFTLPSPTISEATAVPWPLGAGAPLRSEEHTSELQSLMRISYAVFCLKKKITERRKLGNEPRCIIPSSVLKHCLCMQSYKHQLNTLYKHE